MFRQAARTCLVAAFALALHAQEGNTPKGIPHLDHVFVIVMENHSFGQVVGNPNMPFTNKYIKEANYGTNYFAVGHPSLTNYLEIVGGSNFGVRTDNAPDWHNNACTPNLANGAVSTDTPASGPICPIYGAGTDAATPIIDFTNETSGAPGEIDVDGKLGYAANSHTVGMTIADQLANRNMTWKSYQESLPPTGPNGVNVADGFFSNLDNLATALPGEGMTQANLVALYAVKHNPFAYFASVQEGLDPKLSFKSMVGFEGPHGLFADLANGHVPAYSLIAPNQCNDQHGRGNAGPACQYDPNDNGTLVGLNPALMYQGDATLRSLVTAIHQSKVWNNGRTAIITVWDENDYSISPTTNKVLVIVDTNYGRHGVKSNNFYTHFSLLKSVEAGLELPCLNHACDSATQVMSDLFAEGHPGDNQR
jgi:hypothetical protein